MPSVEEVQEIMNETMGPEEIEALQKDNNPLVNMKTFV
jgi:hypothetical protein